MSSGLLALQLFLCSFSTVDIERPISNVPTGFPTNIVVQAELRAVVAQLVGRLADVPRAMPEDWRAASAIAWPWCSNRTQSQSQLPRAVRAAGLSQASSRRG